MKLFAGHEEGQGVEPLVRCHWEESILEMWEWMRFLLKLALKSYMLA